MTNISGLEVLARRGWLSLVDEEFRDAVLRRAVLRKFRSGETIYRFGDPPGGLWAIVDGAVRIEVPSTRLVPGMDHFADPGYWFGEATLIYETPRRVGVITTRSSTLAGLPLADCTALLTEKPSRWRWIALLSTINLDVMIALASDLLLDDPRDRIIATLLRLAGFRHGMFMPPSPIAVTLSQDRLAQIANLSRTVVSEVLLSLQAQGIVDIGYRSVSVIDAKELAALLTKKPPDGGTTWVE